MIILCDFGNYQRFGAFTWALELLIASTSFRTSAGLSVRCLAVPFAPLGVRADAVCPADANVASRAAQLLTHGGMQPAARLQPGFERSEPK